MTNQTAEPEELLDRDQVAVLLGVSKSTIANYEKDLKLRPYRFSSRVVRYSRNEVNKFIEESAKKP